MNWYSIFGLSLDLIGVLFLGIDLVRVQAKLRRRAKKGSALFNKMEADFGEIESWADDIKKRSEWIPERSYSRVHGEDEASYNARHAIETLRELSWAVNGLGIIRLTSHRPSGARGVARAVLDLRPRHVAIRPDGDRDLGVRLDHAPGMGGGSRRAGTGPVWPPPRILVVCIG